MPSLCLFSALIVISKILKWILKHTGNQCKEAKTGVIRSRLLVLVTGTWILSLKKVGKRQKNELPSSQSFKCRTLILAFQAVPSPGENKSSLKGCKVVLILSQSGPMSSSSNGLFLSFLGQHHSEGCESFAAAGQLQSPQHALSQRQAAGQTWTRSSSLTSSPACSDLNPALWCITLTCTLPVHTGSGGQERPVLPQLRPALQNLDVRHSEECEWQFGAFHTSTISQLWRSTQILYFHGSSCVTVKEYIITSKNWLD